MVVLNFVYQRFVVPFYSKYIQVVVGKREGGKHILIHINICEPWLVWLSGLSTGLRTESSLVQFLVRAQAWVVVWAPSWGCARGN